ncbi:hypothetical protein OU995_11005 [Roseateles sp. SL47]|uniref:hypothetical protein n=1 Tax=Roseateles sp. SL47 TaxID=2995138 RepID=UPI00226F7526|nr:hypothetical protein [Roseateles sp. SL47]WAC75189.1 hypothetical protein OU995_11005 [Roseateles sp. SL47]
MTLTELERTLPTSEQPFPMQEGTPAADDPGAQKRLCIAAMMDRHPETFSAPVSAPTWLDFVEQNCIAQDSERLTLDLAIGRLVQVMRIAQESIPQEADLPAVLRRAQEEGVGDLEPDAAVQALASPDASPDDVAVMARAMSLYKSCMANGVAQGDEISKAIDAGFDHVPITSPFMQSLVDTAKEVTLIDVRYALGLSA